jgi:hypothetical protein
MFFSLFIAYPFEATTAQGSTMTFTTGETIDFNSNVYMDFWSNVSMIFTSGIQVQFMDSDGDGMLEPCDVVIVVFPPQFIMEYCSWWEVLYPDGRPTGFEFHIDQQYGPNEFHVDAVSPPPVIPLPGGPGGVNLAEKKISIIEPCQWYVVHEPAAWYPPPCSWWEIIDPETGHPTGYEFHVDITNESCEFHVDGMIPGPYVLPFPWYEIEARKKITQILPCDWYTVITGDLPQACWTYEVICQDQPVGEFHVDKNIPASNLFHVDWVLPDPLNIPPSYPTTARRKISTIEPCFWYRVGESSATPQMNSWWRVIYPDPGDYGFHVDQSNQDGTFHVDMVYPGVSIPITPASGTVTAEKRITTIGSCDWFKVTTGGLPQPCSWWRITSPAQWAGVVFHVDSTDGISKFHIDNADSLPPGPTPPPWSVTVEEYTPPDPWYWKPSYRDYVPSGMPDFDQRQGGAYNWSYLGAWSHCGPVAVANSLWWLDSEFEPSPALPPTINDHFPLVQAYNALWDDHSTQNVPPLVEHLAFLMDTDGRRTLLAHSGTNVNDMQAGLTHYLSWSGVNPKGDVNGDGIVNMTDLNIVNAAFGSTPGSPLWDLRADVSPASTTYPPITNNKIDASDALLVTNNMGNTGLFYEHTQLTPDFRYIEQEVEKCQDVVLLIGYWVWTGSSWYREPGGHYVTVAGVDSLDQKIAISDPVQDAFETGLIPEGRIPTAHVHMPPEPPYITHNDAALVSQDIYSVTQVTPPWPNCPGGNLMLLNFASWRPAPPCFAVVEYAVVTSPLGVHDVAVIDVHNMKKNCVPKPTVCKGLNCSVYVKVENQGDFTETFNVTAYANTTAIGEQTVTLNKSENTTLTFIWDTTLVNEYDNYTISAQADQVNGETDLADNTLSDGTVTAVHTGDINGDGKVDITDVAMVSGAFGSLRNNDPTDPKYGQYWHPTFCSTCPHEPNTDLTGDGKGDIEDLSRTSGNFGWYKP